MNKLIVLLEELNSSRDYWLVPANRVTFEGKHVQDYLKVKKGFNTPEIEAWCAGTEAEMRVIITKMVPG